MGEIVCPICGRSNPVENEICQYCLAPIFPQASTPLKGGTSEHIEDAGPLAGLSGLLSVEPGNIRPRKSPVYPIKLRVSEIQRTHADLLQGLVESEDQGQPIAPKRGISSQHFLRWVIAIVIWGAILWSLIRINQPASLPGYTEETAQVNLQINHLPADARILLAYDYEPGLSAEMDAVATSVVDQLMERGAYLTIVSTSPTGPILAERLMSKQTRFYYINGVNYVNLGYIPGGVIGLLSFLENPQHTLPYSLDMVAAWENESHPALPPLEGIQNIDDFEMIMVIVDDPELARSWIEQVQSQLNDPGTLTSLVMITSAQVEPVVRPYFEVDPKQVDGFVSGLRGSISYAQLTGQGGLSSLYWDAFGFGLLVAALVILIGGLVLSSLAMISNPPRVKGKANQ